jgi:hypothetical protein
MEIQMYIQRLTAVFGVSDNGQRITFNEGDYRLSIQYGEKEAIIPGGLQDQIMAELFSKADFARQERNNQVAYFHPEVDGWTATLAAAAQHDNFMTVQQLVALHYVIRTAKFEFTGQRAYDLIKELWQLTRAPAAYKRHPFPEPSEGDLEVIKLVKFVDEEFGGKSSLHFHLPVEGEMIGMMSGKQGVSIKHLGTVLAGGADIHPYIREAHKPIESVAIEELDPAELFAS